MQMQYFSGNIKNDWQDRSQVLKYFGKNQGGGQEYKNENAPIEELKAGSRRKEVSGDRARIASGLVKSYSRRAVLS